MTQVQSIQQNIYYNKVQLNLARKVICKNEIDKLQNQATTNFYLNELKDLKISLCYAVKQSL